MRGLGALARRYRLATWMTHGTYAGCSCGELPHLHLIDSHTQCFLIGDLEIRPYTVPHDAREPCQFVFRYAGLKLGMLTDTGHITPHIVKKLLACDSLVLEFNHDPEMLTLGPYPPRLQARVGGNHGHLNNQQAVEFLSHLEPGRLQHLVAAHLSEKNNTPERVSQTLLDRHHQLESRLSFAQQHEPSDWHFMTQD